MAPFRPLLLVALPLVAACASPPRLLAQPADSSLELLVRQYVADSADLRRFYTIGASPTRDDRLEAFARHWTGRLAELDDEDLDAAGRIDRLVIRDHIIHDRAERARFAAQRAAADELLAPLDLIIELEEGRWELRAVEASAAARRLDAMAERVERLTERLERAPEPQAEDAGDADADDGGDDSGDDDGDHDATGTSADDAPPIALTPVEALRVARVVDDLREALRTWHGQASDFDPEHDWWVAVPYERADDALGELSRSLRETLAGQRGEDDDPLVGDPIGEAGLAADLAHEVLPYSARQLITLGERELAWCTERMQAAAGELGFDDWHDALEHVKGLHVAPGDQDELVRAQANEAIAFVEERELVTIPPLCRELWRLRMIGEQTQRVLPFAAYSDQHMLVAFPTAGMDDDAKRQAMRGNNIHFSRIVTPHELIPGHHLQGFMAARHNNHRRPFSTPFYGEGWSLYWEMLLWDAGWARSPENRIGMLFWRMHRAARIIVSLRFHLGQMEPEAMIDFLVERVGHERDNATAEVRRYIGGGYSPLYQCGYMIGGLQLRALARELVDEGGWTARQFHDAVLRCGPLPIEYVRALLTETALGADHVPSWRWEGVVEPAGG